MNQFSPEDSFIISVCGNNTECDIDQLLADLPHSFDWTYVVEATFYHGVTGLLCNALISASSGLVPEEMIHASNVHLEQQKELHLKIANQLLFILNQLKADGIQAIPFKGPTLAIAAYGQLHLRSYRDLDILIHIEDAQKCIEKLNQIDYVNTRDLTPRQWLEFIKYSGEEILFGPGVSVEPHWSFAPSTLAINIDFDGIWKRARQIKFHDQSILTMSQEDILIMLCIHGCKEEWSKLKWVVDIAEFIRANPSLSWKLLIDRTKQQHVERIVKIGLSLAIQLSGAILPEKVNDWIYRDNQVARVNQKTIDQIMNINKPEIDLWKFGSYHWTMRERLLDRLSYFLKTVTQPKVVHFADINIPDRFFYLYWPYKLLHDYFALPIWKLIKYFKDKKFLNETG